MGRGAGAWASAAARAAGLASDRPELWIPGSLASLAFLGWLPFLLAVVSVPSAADLEFFGASLATSSGWPLNAVLLVTSAVLVLLAASVFVASGEAALQRRIDRLLNHAAPRRSLDDATARLWVVQLVAALPTLVALGVTVAGIAAVAPGEYQSPDIGGTVLVRIGVDVWPQLAITAVAVVLGIAYGAGSQRAAVRSTRSLAAALVAGAVDLARHPAARMSLAGASLAALLGWLAVSWFVLQLLWRPIGAAMASGRVLESGTPLLLVGFVAVWLCLVVAGGALHGWASAWWSLELEELAGGAAASQPPGAASARMEETD